MLPKRWHGLGAWVLYWLVVVVGGALLSPWIYPLVNNCQQHGGWYCLPEMGFGKFLQRMWLLLAVLGSVPLCRSQGLRIPAALGLWAPRLRWWHGVCGFGVAASSVLLMLMVMLPWAGAEHRLSLPSLRDVFSCIGLGLLVATLEEWYFRGALMGFLRHTLRHHQPLAVLLSIVIFAQLHWLRPDPQVALPGGKVMWWSGIYLLPFSLPRLSDTMVLGSITLILLGWVLSLSVVRSGSLAWAIGLHAGWVGLFKLLKVCGLHHIPNCPPFWYLDVRGGLLLWGLLLVVAVVLQRWLLPKHSLKV